MRDRECGRSHLQVVHCSSFQKEESPEHHLRPEVEEYECKVSV